MEKEAPIIISVLHLTSLIVLILFLMEKEAPALMKSRFLPSPRLNPFSDGKGGAELPR